MARFIFLLILLTVSTALRAAGPDSLSAQIQSYTDGKDAGIGVAVIADGKLIASVNGHKSFPMMSVYKLPISLAVTEKCHRNGLTFSESVHVTADMLNPDTYSPMLKKYGNLGKEGADISLHELLRYSLQESDNNASDILLEWAGGAENVDRYIKGLGITDIHVKWSEDEMYSDHDRSYGNSSTPESMAMLSEWVAEQNSDPLMAEIREIMETCATGTARLAKPLHDTDDVIGHKTGTGFTLPSGRLMAINDAGYIKQKDGRRYSIAVFVADSCYTFEETEALIAEISSIVYEYFKQPRH